MGIFRRDREQAGGEQRAPQVATATAAGRVGLAAISSMSDDWALQRAYYANVYVWACANALAEDLASIAFRVGKDPEKPSSFMTHAPLARLLGPPPSGPNPVTSPEQLWAWTVVQYLVLGRFGWEVELEGNDRPIGLWPLIPRLLEPVSAKKGAQWWSHFEYQLPTGGIKELRPEQVIYGWRPSADDFRKPESLLRSARLDVDVAVMQDRYDKAFLMNDARPASVIVHEEFASVEARDAWRTEFLGRHSGPDNAGRPEFLETSKDGAKPADALHVEQIGLSQADAEFIKRYEAKIRAIVLAFGTPLSRLGDSSNRTFSNADRETKNYWRNKVAPLARQLQQVVNMQLAPRLGREVGWFELHRIEELRPRRFKDLNEALNAYKAKVISQEEFREEANLPPTIDGTMYEPPTAAAPTAPAPAAEVEPEPAPEPTPAPDETAAPVVEQPRVPEPDEAAALEAAAEERRSRIWSGADRATRNLERDFTRRGRRLFAAQMRATLDRLEGKRGRQLIRSLGFDPDDGGEARSLDPQEQRDVADAVFDPAYWEQRTAEEFLAGYEAVFTVAGNEVAAAIGVDFDLDDPWAQSFVNARANQLAGHVTTTTYTAIQGALADGIAAGEGIPGLAARIRTLFEQTYAHRAETVARTEVISAYNGSAYTVGAFYGSDVVAGYEWIAARDARTRESHRSIDGDKVYVGIPFVVGGHHMAYPGDPSGPASETVNCRCTIALLTPDEIGGILDGRGRVPADTLVRLAIDVAQGRREAADAARELVGAR